MELHALADDELVREAVLGLRPRLGEARRLLPGWHRLHQRVVQSVEHHERRDDALGLGGIEPARRKRDVHAPRHGAFGRGGHRIRAAEDSECEEHHDDEKHAHAEVPVARVQHVLRVRVELLERLGAVQEQVEEHGVRHQFGDFPDGRVLDFEARETAQQLQDDEQNRRAASLRLKRDA